MPEKHQDTDPQETQEWIDSIHSVLKTSGIERTHYIIEKLLEFSRRNGVRLPYSAHTDYVNTIQPHNNNPFLVIVILNVALNHLFDGMQWRW